MTVTWSEWNMVRSRRKMVTLLTSCICLITTFIRIRRWRQSMSLEGLMISIPKIDDSSVGVFKNDYTKEWDRNRHEVTRISPTFVLDLDRSDALYANTVDTLIDYLRRCSLQLVERYQYIDPSPDILLLLKQISIAVIAIRDIPKGHVDKALELNRLMPDIQLDGIDDLIKTTAEIREFYSYLGGESGATTQTRSVSGKLTGRFVRPDFPIEFDDYE